jgi:signal transduction histidine kinase
MDDRPQARLRVAGEGKGEEVARERELERASRRIAELEAELHEAKVAFEEKTSALEAANHELRSLTANLDQIVRQRTRALAESESQMRRKNQELDRLNRMKTEFISIAAHELRTPMTSVVGYLDLLLEGSFGGLPQDLNRPITALRRNAHRLKRLIDDMLDITRLETGRITLHRAPVTLNEIVLAVLDELKPIAGEKRHRVGAVLSDIPPIDADADKIHQVVTNLVANSVKYTPEGGEISLTVDLTDRGDGPPMARLRVWDNGIGIPAALLDRIFEPFSEVNAAKHHTSSGPDSAGLGLHIARGIVELHGGRISVDSVEKEYSEFTVLLPLAAEGR